MFVRWGRDAGDSPNFNADVPAADLSVWIRRGDDAFSEDPDSGEDLHIQYQDENGSWWDLDILPGDGTPGETFSRTYTLPSGARHPDLKIGFWLEDGDGEDYDYWHIDDVAVTERPVDSFCESGAVLSDSFEDGGLNPWQTPGGGRGSAGVSQDTAAHGSHSGYTQGGEVKVRSPNTDLSGVTSADLSVWVRRGHDAFSEDPDSGEDLVLEYRTSSGNTWAELQRFQGGGAPGEIFTPSFSLPSNAFHPNFRLRFRMTGGSGSGYDYWHFDDVCLTAVGGGKADHYAISHDGSGITCDAEPVTITAHNPGHNPVDPGNVAIDLDAINQDTGSGEGTWARVITGTGTLSDAAAGDGAASYTFPGGEESVTLAFNYTDVTPATDPETVNFDVNGGNEGTDEDPDLVVSRSALRITDGSGNPVSIPDQIAGKRSDQVPGAQSLGLQAIRASDSDPTECEPAFPDGSDVEVELAGECKDPATCAGRELAITNNGSTTGVDTTDGNGGSGAASYQPVTLRFGANAEADIALTYSDAGAIQFHARYNPIEDGSGTPPVVEYVTGSSNDFVVRPFGFQIGVTDNPAATDGAGPAFQAAGTDFDVTVTARAYQSSDDGAGDGVPDGFQDTDPTNNADLSDNPSTPNFGQEADPEGVDLGSYLYRPSGGSDPDLAPADPLAVPGSDFSGGSATTTASWPEVGIIELTAGIAGGDYLGSGTDAPGRSGPVGRFHPDHFRVDASTLTNRVNRAAASGELFTYLGETFRAAHTLSARSASGGETENYEGAFAYLDPNSPSELGAEAYGKGGFVVLGGRLSGSASGTFNLGSATIDLDLKVNRDGTPEEPFDPLRVGIDPHDADGVTLQSASLDDVDGNGTGDFRILVEPELVYGRLVVENAYGPETADLRVPVSAQSYLDGRFRSEDRDDVTPLGTARITLTDPPADKLAASDTAVTEVNNPLISGEGGLVLEAPGVGNVGQITVTADSLSFLEYDFNNDGTVGDPAGIASFGRHRGDDRILYWREVYQ